MTADDRTLPHEADHERAARHDALAYFDLDLYEPTRAVLEQIRPYLTKGSIVAFDEFAHATPAYLAWEG
jgi:hypothetical protein